MRKFCLAAIVAGSLAASLGGCATPPPDDDPEAKADYEQTNDPLEPTNRVIFDFNEAVYAGLIDPFVLAYRSGVPQFGRDRVSDFLDNLKSPLYFANDLVQGNLVLAGATLERFVINTTFGVLGIMDVAAPMGIPGHKSDFGQTMGVWGYDEGPYLVLPVLGPSNLRDATGFAVEWFADPLDIYLDNNGMHWVDYSRAVANGLVERESYLDVLNDVKRTSLDYYSALRSLYRQRRAAQINAARTPGKYMLPANGISQAHLPPLVDSPSTPESAPK